MTPRVPMRARGATLLRAGLALPLMMLAAAAPVAAVEPPAFDAQHLLVPAQALDSRDQRRYATVSLGGREWFAENLAWLPRVCAAADSDCGIWVYGLDGGELDAARQSAAYRDHGALYSWRTAQTACPAGWSLPSDADWQALELALGLSADEAAAMIWRGPPVAARLRLGGDSGLQVTLAGWRSGTGRFNFAGEHANFWTATAAHEGHAIERLIGRSKTQIGRHTGIQTCGFSVRCVRERPQAR